MGDDERLRLLGLLAVRSAKLEEELSHAFCSLVGGKYAPVVANGQTASWLIEQCQALVKANLEVSAAQKTAMRAALDACKIATEQRNTLLHGVKDGDLRAAASQVAKAQSALHEAIGAAVSAEEPEKTIEPFLAPSPEKVITTQPPGLFGRKAVPPSERVADDLRRRIRGGEWQPGDQLPSTGELAEQYRVARATASRAVRILAREGLTVTRERWGVFVADGEETGPTS